MYQSPKKRSVPSQVPSPPLLPGTVSEEEKIPETDPEACPEMVPETDDPAVFPFSDEVPVEKDQEPPQEVPPEPETPQEAENTGNGYLVVRVTTARGIIPLENVPVTIRNYLPESAPGSGTVVVTTRTDRSGNTERLSLPAPSKTLSEEPGDLRPYAMYNIDIQVDGYLEQFYTGVPIFDGITSVQSADLVPRTANGRNDDIGTDGQYFHEAQNPGL